MEQLDTPVLLSIDLLVGSVKMMEKGVESKLKLNPENIIYANDSKSSQVVIWEILQETGPHQIVIFNYDKVEEERELCVLLGNKKECYLNIFPFQKAN